MEPIESASVHSAGTRTCRGSTVVALAVGEPQKPLFNNRVAPVPQLWLLSITPVLTVVSVEEFVERGRLEKLRKPKAGIGKPTEFWSSNFLGRLYESAVAGER